MLRERELSTRGGVEETRSRIFAATRELYATRGSRGTTTREVADRAGVNEATLFRHFGTKQQLLTAMLEHFNGATNFAAIFEHVRALPTIDEQLRSLAYAAVEAMRTKEDLIKISMAEEVVDPDGTSCAWRAPTEARRLMTEFFSEKVASNALRGDPSWLSRTFMSLFFSLVMARGIWGDEANVPNQAVTTMVDIFLHGARAH